MAALDWSIGRVHTGPVAHASRLLTMAACLSAVSGVLTAQSTEAAPDTAARPGAVAPDFTLLTLGGDTVHLAALRGHPVLLNFWATWCVPCKDEMPRLVDAYERRRAAGLEIVAVNLTDQESLSDVRRFVGVYHVPFGIALDRKGKVRRAYGLRGVPTSVFIDAQGRVRAVHSGPIPADTLDARVGEILAIP